MDNFILALGVDTNTNRVEEITVGTFPWTDIKVFNLNMITPDFSNFKNAYIGFDGNLIYTGTELEHFTKYNTFDGEIIEKSYHILLKSYNNGEKIFLVTDGISNPQWVGLNNMIKQITLGNLNLADARIINKEDGLDIEGVNKEIKEIDYHKFKLITKSYFNC